MNDTLPYVAYNSSNKDRARYNRSHQTDAEKIMWSLLKKKQTGYIFLRQKMIGSFILDFYCSKLSFGIEADGEIHEFQKNYDMQRDERLRHHGIKIIRYHNHAIINNSPGVYEDILQEMEIRKKELSQ